MNVADSKVVWGPQSSGLKAELPPAKCSAADFNRHRVMSADELHRARARRRHADTQACTTTPQPRCTRAQQAGSAYKLGGPPHGGVRGCRQWRLGTTCMYRGYGRRCAQGCRPPKRKKGRPCGRPWGLGGWLGLTLGWRAGCRHG